MSRLLLPIAALLVSGLLATSAAAMPIDANPARSAAMQQEYVAPLGTDVSAADQQSPVTAPAVSSSPAVSDGTNGPAWTISILAGVVLVVAAAGAGTMFGRAHPRPGTRLA